MTTASLKQDRAATLSQPVVTWRTWLMTVLLTATGTLAYIDRQMFGLLAEPIKNDLGFSDTQMGILQGLAFSLFYGTLSVPLGMLADRVSRKKLVIAAILAWSAMTSWTGFAKGFGGMFLARAGTASGEAGMTPAVTSMFPDAFPRDRLALPISIYTFCIYIGSGLAFVLGGWIESISNAYGGVLTLPIVGETAPWRVAFVAAALLGVPWSLILWLGLKEPPRREFSATASVRPASSGGSLRQLGAFFGENRAFLLPHFVGFTLLLGAVSAVLAWNPPILIRIHGFAVEEVGPTYGLLYALFGILGAATSGWLADHLAARGRREGPVDVGILAGIGLAGSSVGLAFADGQAPAMAWATAAVFFVAPCISLPPAILQMLTPSRLRAQMAGLFLMVSGVLGLSLGPIFVGLLTDRVFKNPMMLHFAVAIPVVILSSVAIVILALGRKHFARLAAW